MDVRAELRSLSAQNAEVVGQHLAMARRAVEDDPALARSHALEAVRHAGRLAVVREAAGLACYAAGDYARALAELRAARRINGGNAHLPVMADCERGLGRPERALEMAGAPEVAQLDRAGQVEMRLVAAGARADLGQLEAAVVTLQGRELQSPQHAEWSARLKYGYADALLAVGRREEARAWFAKAAEVDDEGWTDAGHRVTELDGLVFLDAADEPADEPAPDAGGTSAGDEG